MNIKLPIFQTAPFIKVRKKDNQHIIFDVIRDKWLPISPEEFVRQMFIHYLLNNTTYTKNQISVERGVQVGELNKRYDIVIFDGDGKPHILVECKQAMHKLSNDVFEQVGRYNSTIKAPYLLITNGLDTYCCKINFEDNSYVFLDKLP